MFRPMSSELDTQVALDDRLASVLGIAGPDAGRVPVNDLARLVFVDREAIAGAVALLVGLSAPRTSQAVEALSELVLGVQYTDVLEWDSLEYWLGGVAQTGWPIDPETRVLDCVIAAADLGMFERLDPADPDRGQFMPHTAGPPDPALSRTSDGRVSALRRGQVFRLIQGQLQPPRSTHEQFVCDWFCLMEVTVEMLIEALQRDGLIPH
jgi:hypothetical protein